jgi:formylglycine-generating enzyme required for sulfatase activity
LASGTHPVAAPLTNRPRLLGAIELCERLAIETERALRYGRPLAVAVIELGRVDDDQEALGAAAISALRLVDVVGWSGPTSLVIILPATARTADIPARRLLEALSAFAPHARAGLALCPGDGSTAEALIGAARDAARGSEPRELLWHGATVSPLRIAGRDIIAVDVETRRLLSVVERLASSDIPVLVTGETGVGKEIVAAALHHWSPRRSGRLVSINCAALVDSLFESELFGHERGAFSGAFATKIGLLESAAGGTVFLDEVGELSSSAQAKLLRVLETGAVTRVGALAERPIDVRIVAATNRDLQAEVSAGRFRLPEPPTDLPLPPGSYRMTMRPRAQDPVVYPFTVARGEVAHFDLALSEATDVPAGFALVPQGEFLFGTQAEDSVRRGFFHTVPIHEVTTGAYLIAQRECTFGQWLDFLRALPPRERPQRYPAVHGGFEGSLTLRELPGDKWELSFRPASVTYTVRSGDRIVYSGRAQRQTVDWMQLPVVGITADDAEAYARWLATSGRVAGARLCSEREWERAARGADDRLFPHGDSLAPEDADYDETYARAPLAMGPDEVGSHPSSRSPFGLDDMSGNAWEWTRSSLGGGAHAARGGSFYFDVNASRVSNRETPEPTFRDVSVGFRVCADYPPQAESARRADLAR